MPDEDVIRFDIPPKWRKAFHQLAGDDMLASARALLHAATRELAASRGCQGLGDLALCRAFPDLPDALDGLRIPADQVRAQTVGLIQTYVREWRSLPPAFYQGIPTGDPAEGREASGQLCLF